MLAEGVEASLDGVARDRSGDRSLRAAVGRGAVGGGGYRGVVGVGIVVGLVVVEEGRDLKDGGWVEGAQPGEGDDGVALVLAIAKTAGVELLVLEAVGVGVVGNLKVVLAKLGHEAELIFGAAVVDGVRRSRRSHWWRREEPRPPEGRGRSRCGCR